MPDAMALRRLWGSAAPKLLGALALIAASLFLSAPALAAPPPNDDFANAQVIGPALSIELSASNVEATKEEGEPYHGPLGSKGHSVWFKWEATSTGFVTVGTCGSDFETVVSVYTGTAVDELTKVAGDFASEGPGCPSFSGREFTFEAISGTIYEIAVDGDAFYVPPAEPPLGEGTFDLQLKTTPTPSNDDFANAQVLTGSIEEEEGAEFAFYWASARGYNWNATKEEGEPDHAGDPGGASVWYSWTAPGSGPVSISACGGRPFVLAVYSGDSVGALSPAGSNDFACSVSFSADAGTIYRIAVDGQFDEASGSPALGSFSVSVSMHLPPSQLIVDPPPPTSTGAPAAQPDATPPDTEIFKSVLKRRPPIFVFRFHSNEPESTFRCSLDTKPFKVCGAWRSFSHPIPGRHRLRVYAVDPAGNKDPTPAVAHFRFPKQRKHHRRHNRHRRHAN